jgi:hypothetical protein
MNLTKGAANIADRVDCANSDTGNSVSGAAIVRRVRA